MRKNLAVGAVVCAVAVVAPAASAASAADAADAPVDPGFSRVCAVEYNADQVPALAAGLNADDILYHSGSRADALALWTKKQDELRAGLGENGWGALKDIDKDSLWPVEEHTTSSVIADDLGSSKTGAPSTFDTPFTAGEVAYFKSAASYTAQRFQDCGKDINRTEPTQPSSLGSTVAPGAIVGIVAAVLAVLGVGAAFAGMIPGLTLPALPF
ncbi:hypothetical protein IRY31_02565 [Corynebacterium afermentans subsp. lipophilum]|uniref:hypothetical protein n=1 Tax=Corynebacterium afermentans TaxID=38286 RepID=UPI00188C307B|nr:hypothetical protein [Corynebacterium afermentans]MBF4546970.1 hypothetical protein [Corynebacterium afermentans subsp. lipophilum]WJY59330.1 hypothetical protein CAFEL_07865 [Corynebacterium afermentans subsp. lipophilum]